MINKKYYVYIITNSNHSVLYIGVTSNLEKRIYEHKNKLSKKSFSSRYNLNKLVYYEEHDNPISAISREKQLKHFNREWKERLIGRTNKYWIDLSEEWEL
jgi:putative endonuclease